MGFLKSPFGLLLIVLACASARRVTFDLAPFHTLSVCAPVDVKVKPGAIGSGEGADYKLNIRSKQVTRDVWDAEVVDGVLHLATAQTFGTQEDLEVTVVLPARALERIELRAAASVYVEPGFVSESVELVADTLLGSISVQNADWKTVDVRASGQSRIFAEGTFRNAVIDASDTASVKLSGLSGVARVDLAPEAKALFVAVQGARIRGFSKGGSVLYRGATCSVKDTQGADKCVEDSQLILNPPPAFLKCTVTLSGDHSCSAGSQGTSAAGASKACQASGSVESGEPKASRKRRKLHQSTSALAAAQALLDVGSRSAQPTSYTFTSTSTGGGGTTTVTSCNFFNNEGSCTINGSPVPTVEVVSGPVPGPGPAQQALLNRVASSLSGGNSTTQSISSSTPTTTSSGTTVTSTSSGSGSGTTVVSNTGGGSSSSSSCTFVNGVGGCTTG